MVVRERRSRSGWGCRDASGVCGCSRPDGLLGPEAQQQQGVHGLPLAIALNFRVNSNDVLVPMAVVLLVMLALAFRSLSGVALSMALLAFTLTALSAVMAVYFVAYVAITALSLPGAVPMTLVGGALFGFWLGTLLVIAGIIIAIVTLLLIGGVSVARGGVLFNPGIQFSSPEDLHPRPTTRCWMSTPMGPKAAQ